MSFNDFNNAEITKYNLIPRGTIAKVRLRIKPGNYNDESKGLIDGYASISNVTGSIYLNCEYTILQGEYAMRKVWSLIGLYSTKNNNRWGNIGKGFIRSILNSSAGFTDSDNSPEAIAARKVKSIADLDGIEFVARIDITSYAHGIKNVIKSALTPEHKQYKAIMEVSDE